MPFLIGIIFQYYQQANFPYLYGALVLLILLIIINLPVLAKLRTLIPYNGFAILLLFLLLGAASVQSTFDLKKSNYFFQPGKQLYQVYVNKPPEEKEKSIKLDVDVIGRNFEQTIGKSIVYLQKSDKAKALKYGDIVLLNTNFNTIKTSGNPEAFDYEDFLKKAHIYHQNYTDSLSWKKIGHNGNFVFDFTYRFRAYLEDLIDQSTLKVKNKTIAKALLLGQKEDLDKDTLRTYSSAGAMHVLAVSGLHVGIIMLILMFVFKPIKLIKFGPTLYVGIIVFCLWFYAFVTGLSPSVFRSALMFSFVVIGRELQRETSIYQSILVSAFILVIIDPLVIFKVGFQLSYLAVLGIVYIQPKIYNLVYIKYKWLDYIWQITCVSIAAQIATFPLGLYYFHQFPNYFFISNLLVIPLAGLILVFGLSFFVLFKIPILNDVLITILDGLLTALNYSVEKVEQIPYSIIWGISISWYETIIIYISLFFLVFAFSLRKVNYLIFGGLSSAVLLALLIYNSHQISNQNQLVIYNVKNEIALDVFYGRNNYFVSSQSFYQNQNQLLFNVQHNWFKFRQEEKPYEFIDLESLQPPLFKLNQKYLAIVNDESPKLLADFVVIGDIDFIDSGYLEALAQENTQLIFSGKCSYKVRNYIQNNYPKDLCYDLNTQGAFTFSF